MRLSTLDTPHGWRGRLKLTLMRVLSRREPPDIVKLHLHRYDLYGRPMSRMVHEAMRGPSEWSVFERELMAAYVSRLGQCVF